MNTYKLDINWKHVISGLSKNIKTPFYELLANSFDANANNVTITVYYKDLGGTEKIEILDEGEGILDRGK